MDEFSDYFNSIRNDIYGEDVRDSILYLLRRAHYRTIDGEGEVTVGGISHLARSWHIVRDYGSILDAASLVF